MQKVMDYWRWFIFYFLLEENIFRKSNVVLFYYTV